MSTFKTNVPLPASAAGGVLNVLQGSAITAGNGSHGTAVKAGTTGAYIAGTSLLARALLIEHETTTVGSAVTEAKVSLYEATDANGTGSTALVTATFAITPTAGARYVAELDLQTVDGTKFYALGVSWKASSGSNNTGTGGTSAFLLDPMYVS
jgi:hypothetical protein